MSEPENFITRWSRRKHDAAKPVEETDAAEAAPVELPSANAAPDAVDKSAEANETPATKSVALSVPAFDVTQLPSLESIAAQTDIRAFLAPGVPPELTRAALRRAWAADPQIRDFVGLAENAWDFTAPDAMAGFGPLEMTDELRRAVIDIVGRNLKPAEPRPEAPAVTTASTEGLPPAIESADKLGVNTTGAPTLPAPGQDELVKSDGNTRDRNEEARLQQEIIAVQYCAPQAEDEPVIVRRPRGGALPK